MPAKQVLIAACALVILGGGVANAGPCNTGQTTGMSNGDKAAQEGQRQEHAQPSVAEQPKSTGTTGQSTAGEQGTASSSKMTDTDQSPTAQQQTSGTSSKMADQGC
jgi:hypothetical protein